MSRGYNGNACTNPFHLCCFWMMLSDTANIVLVYSVDTVQRKHSIVISVIYNVNVVGFLQDRIDLLHLPAPFMTPGLTDDTETISFHQGSKYSLISQQSTMEFSEDLQFISIICSANKAIFTAVGAMTHLIIF